MNHPQSKALIIGNNCQNIGDNACCAFTAMWVAGYEPEDGEAIAAVSRALMAGVVEKDCTVIWKPFYQWLTGRNVKVTFKDITSLSDLKGIEGRILVRFDYGTKSHWVGVENCEIKFNSLETSVCVLNGKPATARIIDFGIIK